MKALQTIDSRIVALHQMLVDHFDRPPIALARHCIGIMGVCLFTWLALAFNASKSISWIMLTISVLAPILLSCVSLSPAMFAALGAMPMIRLMGALTLAIEINGLTITPVSSAINATSTLAALSFFYLGACRPPRPRRRNEHTAKLAHSADGA